MIDDEFDDIFDMMNRMFGGRTFHSRKDKILKRDMYERLMDEDNIYYTFELRQLNKEDIDVQPDVDELELTLAGREAYRLRLPYEIYPKETKITFNNGILDIICKIDKDKSDRIEIG